MDYRNEGRNLMLDELVEISQAIHRTNERLERLDMTCQALERELGTIRGNTGVIIYVLCVVAVIGWFV